LAARKPWLAASAVLLATVLLAAPAAAQSVSHDNPATDAMGAQLQRSFIWTQETPTTKGFLNAVFRRSFELPARPSQARFHLFAYTRYQLYVNGEYVGRGPNRFENRRPEYDTWDLSSRLQIGRNVIAVLVHRDWPGEHRTSFVQTLSRIRLHQPGLTARLEMQGADGRQETISTDESWRAFAETGFSAPAGYCYSSIPDNYDARKSPGEWQSPEFDDRNLPPAAKLDTLNLETWPVLWPRTIPLLRESDVPFRRDPESPAGSLEQGGQCLFRCRRIVQAYWVLDIDAAAGAKLAVTPLLPEGHKGTSSFYVCREGHQRWIGGDTFGLNALSIRVESGKATVRLERLVEVLYPFDLIGSFSSSDPLLDRIWQLTARSLELLSEDAYTDCADRERSEWMDCDPPMYEASRVMMAGPMAAGAKVWSDPRLFANMLRRVALTQEPDGMLRARTCSDLLDIHTRMEDRACDWVEGLRKYCEATGDKALIRELWPECQGLLQWFADHRTGRGLVKAREWIAWDNPMSYATCEGAANNAFFQRAFADGAWLARQIGNESAAAKWSQAADQLYRAFNLILWDEPAGAYASAAGTPEVLPEDQLFKKAILLKTVDGRAEPTLHANLFALDRGLVPPARRARVVAWVLAHEDQIRQIMANYYYFKILYGLDEQRCDQIVLDRIRRGWKEMVESPWQTTWEMTGGEGSKMHCYGIVPGCILSTYVLGVRRDAPVWRRQLIIEPHLADLSRAEGIVVTEFGPVSVSWRRQAGRLRFDITVPQDVETALALPNGNGHKPVILDGQSQPYVLKAGRCIIKLNPGSHQGSY
jgi:hypothetical protein